MPPTDHFQLAGQVLDGRYRVDRVVGEGGFGVVYQGFHLAFALPIAIKCLKTPSHFTEEGQATFIAKFREEAQLLSRLSQHPSIVRVYDYNTVPTPRGIAAPYMVLEWLDGEPLDAWLAARGGQPVPEAEAVALLRPAIEALAFAHAQSVAHRDVKPANIFVLTGLQGRSTKVLDFGIAKAMQEGETATQLKTRTSSGFSAFSPAYGAPEQFLTKKFGPTGPWTDVHALGLILTEMVTGRPALEGEEQGEFFIASMNEERPTPLVRGGAVSEAFDTVCGRALQRAAAGRYRDAGELLRALDAAMGAAPAVVSSQRSQRDPSVATVLPGPAWTPPPVAPPPRTAPWAPAPFAPVAMPPAAPGPGVSTTAPVARWPAVPLVPTFDAPQFGPPPPPQRRGVLLAGLVGVVALGGIGLGALAARGHREVTAVTSASVGPPLVVAAASSCDAGDCDAGMAIAATEATSAPPAVASSAPSASPSRSTVAGGHSIKPPSIRQGATSVNGRLPPEVIQRIVRQNFGRFRTCYENGLKNNPNLQGRVAVKFAIGRDGSVVMAADGGSDLPDSTVVACVVRGFGGLSFPQPEGGMVTVVYPIIFTPGD